MNIQEQVRKEVRFQIKEQVKDSQLKEGVFGDTLRAVGFATGVASSVISVVVGATISAVTFNMIPFYFGAAGAATSVLRTKLLFKLADKIDNVEVRYQFKKMGKLVKERDELLVQIDSSDNEFQTETLKRKVERLTSKQQSLAKNIKKTFRNNPESKEFFTEKQRKQVDEMIDFAEQGALTTFQTE